ncbi:MAG TPA: fibronectin-binding domain-containing protein [Candidatus Korarchaeota archaeon]|nr:fibronectin-binding domain-containing protein [Candidatus Korarchaeota archaeon]
MGKRRITGLDLRHLVRELSALEDRILKKVYSINDHTFSLAFYPEVDGCRELILDVDGFAFLTNLKWTKPQVPPPFVMALRKHLEGKKISSVTQLGVERILVMEFSGRESKFKLITELFGGGNIILVSDEGKIMTLLRRAEYRGRALKPGETYKPPESRSLRSDISSQERIFDLLRSGEVLREPLWRVLIELFGAGPPYTDEVAAKLGVNARSPLSDIEDKLAHLSEILHRFLNGETEATVYTRGEKVTNFSAFPLEHLKDEKKRVGSLSEAIQLYYTSEEVTTEEDPRIVSLRKEIERQEALKEEYARKSQELKSLGDLIYLHLDSVEDAIRRARRGDASPIVRNLDRKSGTLVITLDGKEIKLDILKSATENASDYYEKAKKLREKYERMDDALASLRKKLARLEEEALEESLKRVPVQRRKLRWYERYRWFFTPSGLLVIAGRDAQSNAEIVSKYLEEKDFFFHVDMPGGAVVVLKRDQGSPDEESVRLAATAAASFSRAWKEGLVSADVYYVKGDQVSKHAPPGMYLPKGSFYIVGKRNYMRVRLEICVGFQETPDGVKLTSAPPGAPFIYSICLRPGPMGKEEAAKVLKNRLEAWLRKNINIRTVLDVPAESVSISVDEILRVMPPGKVAIVE